MKGEQAGAFDRAIGEGGVVVFPSDTVYGLACDPTDSRAIERLYALKGRAAAKAAAVMFFDLHAAFAALPTLGSRTRELLHTLLPGPVTVLLPNPERRFGLACGEDPDTLGIRVVSVPTLAGARCAVLQSSANPSGDTDPRRLADVTPALKAGADLVIDGGELPGTASTVLDLRSYETDGEWSIVREGPVSEAVIAAAVEAGYKFEPEGYYEDVIEEVHDFEALQAELVAAAAPVAPLRILELGTGTGETARRLLDAFPGATVVGVDGSPAMMSAALAVLPGDRFEAVIATLAQPLPDGPFDVVASSLTVHHLEAAQKAELFGRIRGVLRDGGRFVLADVVVPETASPEDLELTFGFDKPSSAADQLAWMREAGFPGASIVWVSGDLAVMVGTATAAGRLD